jgi:uncharacterized protein YggL (DUF469 family)
VSAACPVLGFDVVVRLRDGIDAAAADAVWRLFRAEAVEGNGLAAEGGGGRTWRVTIVRDGGQATEADRIAVSAWAAGHEAILSCEVGPIVDVGGAA